MEVISIIIIIAVIYIFWFYTNEHMTNVPDESKLVVDKVYDFIVARPEATFEEYINFLVSIDNTNLHLINNDVFAGFKALQKKGRFSKQDVVDEMKL